MSALLSKDYFLSLVEFALEERKPKAHLFIHYIGEQSDFTRFNAAKIRQTGNVLDASISIDMLFEKAEGLSTSTKSLNLSGDRQKDEAVLRSTLRKLEDETAQLPPDPFAIIPESHESSETEVKGDLPSIEDFIPAVIEPVKDLDLVGILATGPMARGMATSEGLCHWFRTETYSFDYSIFDADQKSVKGSHAGIHWNAERYQNLISQKRELLPYLNRKPKRIEPGKYRTYLAPGAANELLGFFSWGGVSEFAIQQGTSPLTKMRTEGRTFSPRFSLKEDFSLGRVPRFNSFGELSPTELPVISEGKLVNSLVSKRTEKEFGVKANGANPGEGLRAASMMPGSLKESAAFEELYTGLYLSNLHYLNWSDEKSGRITGMTRYACFWVENGKIVAPIENLRFDDTLYALFGEHLINVTSEPHEVPEVHTYYHRGMGSAQVPGMLVSEMSFTL